MAYPKQQLLPVLGLGLAALLAGAGSHALASDASQLGTTLTPLGAEMAGSKDGRIPAWKNEPQASEGWAWGKLRKDFWKYKNDKSQYTINAANMAQHADLLTPGQMALLKQNPGFQMDVYPTRRSCGVPDFVAENTRKNAGTAKLGADGWSLKSAVVPGTPFPLPASGAQAMMNMKMRYRGIGVEFQNGFTMVSPRRGSEDWIMAGFEQNYYFPAGKKGSNNLSETGNVEYYTYFTYKSPAALAGQALAANVYLDNPSSETFYYFPGQRRVRRLPAYAYDAPLIGYENQYPADISFVFYGNPDRFDWKIVGKKEVYVPYNGFAMQRFTTKLEDAMGPTSVKAGMRRYELHRVWEVEGTVKAGVRHATPKKTLYLDEDTWLVAVGDDYDAQGKIWKAKENYITPQWEIGACASAASVYNDLISTRYVLDETVIGTGKDLKFHAPGSADPRLKDGYFTGENLGAISDR